MILSEEKIKEIWNSMPDGHDGFLKSWGYVQFAQCVAEAAVCKAEKRDVVFGDGQRLWVSLTCPVSDFEAAAKDFTPRVKGYQDDLGMHL